MRRLSSSFLPHLLLLSALLLYPLAILADEQAVIAPQNTTQDLNSNPDSNNTPTQPLYENNSSIILPTPEGLKDFSIAPEQLVPQPGEQQPAPDAESRFKHALKQYTSGRYKKCIEEARRYCKCIPRLPVGGPGPVPWRARIRQAKGLSGRAGAF